MSARRIGKVRIARQVIQDEPETARAALSGLIILRAEMLLHADEIEYIAEGDAFDLIEQGTEPPEYVVVVNRRRVPETTQTEITFKRAL